MCLIYRIIWGKTRLDNKHFKVEWCCQPSTNFHKSIKSLSSLLGSSLEFFFLSKIFFFLQDCRSNYLYRGISSRDKKVTRHDFCLSLIKKKPALSRFKSIRDALFFVSCPYLAHIGVKNLINLAPHLPLFINFVTNRPCFNKIIEIVHINWHCCTWPSWNRYWDDALKILIK